MQRRHQKLIEESPGAGGRPRAARAHRQDRHRGRAAVGYRSAGTIEGLLQDGEYFFLEMNTRVQVEHCVTEMVTGIDIVREQIKIAAGEPLSLTPGRRACCAATRSSAASTPRTPPRTSPPRPGRISSYREPAGPFVRVDSGAEAGYEMLPLYDPMIAKLIVWDVDREASTRRMLRALGEFEIGGLKTLIPFHQALLGTDQWRNGETCRDLVEDKDWLKQLAFPAPEPPARGRGAGRRSSATTRSRSPGARFDVKVIGAPAARPNGAAPARRASRRRGASARRGGGGGAPGELVSPIQGTVLKVAVEKGAQVEEGALICVIEAMKMENEITAPRRARSRSSACPRAARSPPATPSPSSNTAGRAESLRAASALVVGAGVLRCVACRPPGRARAGR